MTNRADYLGPILARKRREIARRKLHTRSPAASWLAEGRASLAVSALSRGSSPLPRVIAEIKLRSPSAGQIKARSPGMVAEIARAYAAGGAAAISVLCDRAGFGGSPLDLRRAARAVALPVLFKEFVLDPAQLPLAGAMGAHMVLLLVRALPGNALAELVDASREQGLCPVVEAADEGELEIALATDALVVGVNARDLRTFRVDTARALSALAQVPKDRVAVHMSGVAGAEDLARIADSRADAVLIGEALMRAPDPGKRLAELLAGARLART